MKILIAILIGLCMFVYPGVARADAGPTPTTHARPGYVTSITYYSFDGSVLQIAGTTTSAQVAVCYSEYYTTNAYLCYQAPIVAGTFNFSRAATGIYYFQAIAVTGGNYSDDGYDGGTYDWVIFDTPAPVGGYTFGELATSTPISPTLTSVPPTATPIPPSSTSTPLPGGSTGDSGGGSGTGLFDPSPVMTQLLATAASIFNGLAPIFFIVGGVVLGLMALQQIVAALRSL